MRQALPLRPASNRCSLRRTGHAGALLTPVKLGFLVSFYFASLSGLDAGPRGVLAGVAFIGLLAVAWRNVAVDLRAALKALLLSLAIVGIDAVIRPFQPIHLAWYVVLLVLLQVGCGSVAAVPRGRWRPNRSLDVICGAHLIVLTLSSYLYFTDYEGLVNPNVSAALSGFLLLVYVLDHRERSLFNSSSKVMIWLCFAALFAQLSRSALIWIFAAYFLNAALLATPQGHMLRWAKALSFVLIAVALVPALMGESFDVDAVSDFVLNMPTWLRTKEGGLDSDVLRFVRYPMLLASQISSVGDLIFGLGMGERPYLDQLSEGEDLHNAFLVVISDGGLLLLIAVLIFAFGRGKDGAALSGARGFVFLSGMVFSGVLLGLAPFTLSVMLLFIAARSACSNADARKRKVVHSQFVNKLENDRVLSMTVKLIQRLP